MRAVDNVEPTLTILCFGVIDTTWFEAAFAEGSTTSSYRIIATYRVDFGGFNLGKFRLTKCSVGPNIGREAKGNSP